MLRWIARWLCRRGWLEHAFAMRGAKVIALEGVRPAAKVFVVVVGNCKRCNVEMGADGEVAVETRTRIKKPPSIVGPSGEVLVE